MFHPGISGNRRTFSTNARTHPRKCVQNHRLPLVIIVINSPALRTQPRIKGRENNLTFFTPTTYHDYKPYATSCPDPYRQRLRPPFQPFYHPKTPRKAFVNRLRNGFFSSRRKIALAFFKTSGINETVQYSDERSSHLQRGDNANGQIQNGREYGVRKKRGQGLGSVFSAFLRPLTARSSSASSAAPLSRPRGVSILYARKGALIWRSEGCDRNGNRKSERGKRP